MLVPFFFSKEFFIIINNDRCFFVCSSTIRPKIICFICKQLLRQTQNECGDNQSKKNGIVSVHTVGTQKILQSITSFHKAKVEVLTNVVCCCSFCNNSKSHIDWEDWYYNQDFFTEERYDAIINWMKPKTNPNLYTYGSRRNNAT